MKGCRRARARITRASEGELELGERLLLDEHVAACAACRARYEASLAVEEALQALPEPPVERLDLDLVVARVNAGIDSESGALTAPTARAVPRRAALVAVAAALLVAVGLLLFGGSDGTPARDGVAVDPGRPLAVSTAPGPDLGVPAPGDAIEPARLDRAREVVARELTAHFGGIDALEPEAADLAARLGAFEEATRELARSWPIRGIAERFLVGPDVETARAAACYLGARGSALSSGALRDALVRRDVAPHAVLGLRALGADGLDGLVAALGRPELVPAARAGVVDVGGERAARAVEEGLGGARAGRFPLGPDEGSRRGALLGALPDLGSVSVASTMRLRERGALTGAETLRTLEETPGAGPALAALLRADPDRYDPVLALDALSVLGPEEALPWVAERAEDRRLRERALACLASYRTPEALAVLVEMHATGRVSGARVVEAAQELLAAAPAAALDLARRQGRLANGDPALLELLLECSTPGTGAALVELALVDQLSSEERQWSALAVGELGDEEDAERMARALPDLGPDRHLLAAAFLLSIDRLAGTELVLRAVRPLTAFDRGDEDEVLALLDEASSEGFRATLLYRIARTLEDSFDPKREPARTS